MSIITDVPKDFVIIENKEVPIYTDFRNWIKIDNILNDKAAPAEKKIADILRLSFKRLPDNIGQAFDAAAEFYNPYFQKKQTGRLNNKKRLYSFEYDAPYIYAAFLSEYGINLHNTNMHWHTFLALITSLGSDCTFSKIIAIRNMDTSELTGKQKSLYNRLKSIYSLPSDFVSEETAASELAAFF